VTSEDCCVSGTAAVYGLAEKLRGRRQEGSNRTEFHREKEGRLQNVLVLDAERWPESGSSRGSCDERSAADARRKRLHLPVSVLESLRAKFTGGAAAVSTNAKFPF
jgi:hypothetical protein